MVSKEKAKNEILKLLKDEGVDIPKDVKNKLKDWSKTTYTAKAEEILSEKELKPKDTKIDLVRFSDGKIWLRTWKWEGAKILKGVEYDGTKVRCVL